MKAFTIDILGPPILTIVNNTGQNIQNPTITARASNGAQVEVYWMSPFPEVEIVSLGNGVFGFNVIPPGRTFSNGGLMVKATNRAGEVIERMTVEVKRYDPPVITVTDDSGSGGTVQTVTVNATDAGVTTAAFISGGSGITILRDSNTQFRFTGTGDLSGTVRFTSTNEKGSSFVDVAVRIVNIPQQVSISGPSSRFGQSTASVSLSISPPGATTSVVRLRGNALAVSKQSETSYTFRGDGGGGVSQLSATYRFTASYGGSTATHDCTVTVSVSRSCFVAGSLVTMEDGSHKPIELVGLGERVKTPHGSAEVTFVDLPLLGERKLLAFADGKAQTSAEHSIWGRDPDTGEQWWFTRDMEQWKLEAEDGSGASFDPAPVDLTDYSGNWEVATEQGFITTHWVEVEPELGEMTQLYHLYLDKDEAYFVDGYLVSALASKKGDWENYNHPE